MSWHVRKLEAEKKSFIKEWEQGETSFKDLCLLYGISRKTGYKLLHRYEEEGESGLLERSRARHTHPNKTSQEMEASLVLLKQRYPYWGPNKLHAWLERECPDQNFPAASTIGEVLKRHGLVKRRRKRLHVPAYAFPFEGCDAPNKVWSADFKGQFRLGNEDYCYPLTITDNYSRYLLAVDGFARPTYQNVRRSFERVFAEHGLPDAIRTDNGQPFAGCGLGGLTQLSIWFLKLGILPERISPGKPQENGRHERMHRTLKEATAKPSQNNFTDQQSAFDHFRQEYNQERPHEALDNHTPGDIYIPSYRELPALLREIQYPRNMEVRRVRSNGEIKWLGKKYFAAELLYGEPLGFEMIDEGRAIVYFAKLKLGIIDIRLDHILRF